MSVSLKMIEKMIEDFSPVRFACDWDNSGFNINLGHDVDAVLVCLDVTGKIIEEAVQKKCGLIVSHHPLFFKSLRNIDASAYEGKMAAQLIRRGISLYCAHTSMDSSPEGINTHIAGLLGLKNTRFIQPGTVQKFNQIGVYVPQGHEDAVARAMGDAGAGMLGNYRDCAYFTQGEGRFRPTEGANPFIGEVGRMEKVAETKIEAICADNLTARVVEEMLSAHPYEEAAYYITELKNSRTAESGLGVIGDFEEGITLMEAAKLVKERLHIDHVRVSGEPGKTVKKAGLCGGSAGDLIPMAEDLGADLFITGEVKHSMYVAADGMALIEAGHFDTEKCFIQLFRQGLQKRANALKYNLSIFMTENQKRPFITLFRD
jgi:dinuclear metal center YbgI/SA1388 family protein